VETASRSIRLAAAPRRSRRTSSRAAAWGTVDPGSLTEGEKITDHVLTTLFGTRSRLNPSNEWFFEGREVGRVYAGFQRDSYYIHVALDYDDRAVTTNIVRSENLDQGGGRIHKAAVLWVHDYHARLRRYLGVVAERNLVQQKMTPPATVPASPDGPIRPLSQKRTLTTRTPPT
jgi:hypothetical protein